MKLSRLKCRIRLVDTEDMTAPCVDNAECAKQSSLLAVTNSTQFNLEVAAIFRQCADDAGAAGGEPLSRQCVSSKAAETLEAMQTDARDILRDEGSRRTDRTSRDRAGASLQQSTKYAQHRATGPTGSSARRSAAGVAISGGSGSGRKLALSQRRIWRLAARTSIGR